MSDPDGEATPLDRTVKQVERMRLLRAAVPLISAGLGTTWLYASFASSSGLTPFWIGVPLGLGGSTLAAVGLWLRLREIASSRPSTGRHYGWLFLGWALVVAGLLIPPYMLA